MFLLPNSNQINYIAIRMPLPRQYFIKLLISNEQ